MSKPKQSISRLLGYKITDRSSKHHEPMIVALSLDGHQTVEVKTTNITWQIKESHLEGLMGKITNEPKAEEKSATNTYRTDTYPLAVHIEGPKALIIDMMKKLGFTVTTEGTK